MAYWLFCQACKQWSKSPVPLSDDKSCPFCNSLFIKVKQRSQVNSDDAIEKLKKTRPESSISPEAALPLKVENDSGPQEETAPPEMISEPGAQAMSAASAELKIPIPDSATYEPEAVSDDTRDKPPVPVSDNVTDGSETLPEPEPSAMQVPPDMKEITLNETETSARPEVSELEQEPGKPVLSETHPMLAETEIESFDKIGKIATDTTAELELSVLDENQEHSEPGSTPAHRIYLEDKRRKRGAR